MVWLRRATAITVACGLLGYAEMLGPRGLSVIAVGYMALPMIAILYGDPWGSSKAESLGISGYDTIIDVLGWLLLFCTPLVLHAFKWKLELGQ